MLSNKNKSHPSDKRATNFISHRNFLRTLAAQFNASATTCMYQQSSEMISDK